MRRHDGRTAMRGHEDDSRADLRRWPWRLRHSPDAMQRRVAPPTSRRVQLTGADLRPEPVGIRHPQRADQDQRGRVVDGGPGLPNTLVAVNWRRAMPCTTPAKEVV